MSDLAIQVEHLAKKYRIGQPINRNSMLREAIVDGWNRIRHSSSDGSGDTQETVWALRDVSLDIFKGEVVGVIGYNGAGKSTLLKILSRITEPSSGRAAIYGRVGSLLEVGTGFHPELSGRENIYLNGAILGMHRKEITSKFDEIVTFAEIEQFLDTPVKRYSSGMYVRLAFAVAAHLETEILLVDEVLAVGDLAFQRKSLGKMNDVAKEGRTVLFVSHNLSSISQLCERCVIVEHGKIAFDGDTKKGIAKYLDTTYRLAGTMNPVENGHLTADEISISSVSCEPSAPVIGSPFAISLTYFVSRQQKGLRFGVSIENEMGQRVTASYSGHEGKETGEVSGSHVAQLNFPILNLIPGQYYVTVAIHNKNDQNVIRVDRIATFDLVGRDLTDSGYIVGKQNGLVWLDHDWSLQ